MAEIDLVPEDYRSGLKNRSLIYKFLASVVVLVMLTAGAKIWLGKLIVREAAAVEKLEADKKAALEGSVLLVGLKGQKTANESLFSLASRLREGFLAEKMFVIISRAISSSGWISEWKFMRSGEVRINNFQQNIQIQDKLQAWNSRPHMEISGSMLNHAALVEFVENLAKRPEISDVQIVRTNYREYGSVGVIEYQLQVALK